MNVNSGMLALFVAGFCAASAHQAMAATPYRVTDLGTLGGTFSFASGINANGQVTGAAETDDGAMHAFLYNGGALIGLGTLGGSSSQGAGINAGGLVTGTAGTSGSESRAFLYSGGPLQDLGTLGGTSSFGNDINASGHVTGEARTADGSRRAFLYSNGSMQPLGDADFSVGWGINDSGQVTGESGTHAFLYSGGTMQDIHTQGDASAGRDLNASGDVTGSFDDNLAITTHAFLYSGGSMQDLGSVGGYEGSIGLGINAGRWVVGVAFPAVTDDPDVTAERAFLYDGASMHDLNSLLDGSGDGWVLHQATDINDAGRIVGYGTHDGQTRAFLLTPVPEPANHALMAAGLGLMGAFALARRRGRGG
jgi:probable HAF family extracellular repeat protein